MKFCFRCQTHKSYTDFRKNKSKKDGLNNYCTSCMVVIQKEYYKKNGLKVRSKTKEQRVERIRWFKDYKSKLKCSQCDENHIACLEFHHTEDDKEHNVGLMIWTHSIKRTIREIQKCIVICSNCHRKLHYATVV